MAINQEKSNTSCAIWTTISMSWYGTCWETIPKIPIILPLLPPIVLNATLNYVGNWGRTHPIPTWKDICVMQV